MSNRQDIGGLKDAVQHVGRVYVLQRAEVLVRKVLSVVIGQRLPEDIQLIHVHVHELGNRVHVPVAFAVAVRNANILKDDHLLLISMAQHT